MSVILYMKSRSWRQKTFGRQYVAELAKVFVSIFYRQLSEIEYYIETIHVDYAKVLFNSKDYAKHYEKTFWNRINKCVVSKFTIVPL